MAPPGKGEGRRPPDDAPNAPTTTQAQPLEPEVKVKDNGRGDNGQRYTPDVAVYQVGYGTGYDIGYAHGRRDENDEWQTLLGVYRAAVRTPRHVELETARQPTDEPCPTRCRTCSRCTRYAQVYRNRRLYGTCDYPGGGAGW